MDPQIKICVLTYKKLHEIARDVLSKGTFTNMNILLLESTPDTVSEQVRFAISQGCEAFVAGSSNAAEFRRISQMPLVEIQIHHIDYVIAVKKALNLGQSPAVFTYRFSQQINLDFVEDILQTKLQHVVYEDSYDLIQQLTSSPADVIIGTSAVLEAAESLSKKCVQLYAGENAVEEAILRCCHKAEKQRKWFRMQEIYRTVLANSDCGVIGMNEDAAIILYNTAAVNITGISSKRAQGQNVRELFPWAKPNRILGRDAALLNEQVTINGNYYRAFYTRINFNSDVIGAIMILKPISDIGVGNTVVADTARPLQAAAKSFDCIKYKSSIMAATIASAKRYGSLDDPLVIVGPAGSGRSYFANCIHNQYVGQNRPILTVDCATIDPRQAPQFFLGREDGRGSILSQGLFERCSGGTLVLENLNLTSTTVQRHLTQLIKTSRFQRMNGNTYAPLTVKLIALISDEDWAALRETLDPEFYYRLTTLVLHIPALAQRREDIPELFRMFVNPLLPTHGAIRLSGDVKNILTGYSWPGNMQELYNVARRFTLDISQSSRATSSSYTYSLISSIGEETLFQDLIAQSGGVAAIKTNQSIMLSFVREVKQILSYNNERIAQKLGISRTTLWRLTKAGDEDNAETE